MPADDPGNLAEDLLRIGAVKFGAFRLKLHDKDPSAPLSPIYVDLRLLRSDPSARTRAVSALGEIASRLEWDVLADVPTAATPLVAILADRTGSSMVSPRKDEKSHGLSQKLDGWAEPGQVALVVDDLITRADSKLEAIQVLRENGLVTKDVLVLLDRQQGGREALEGKGFRLHSVLQLKAILDHYDAKGLVPSPMIASVRSYLASNAA
jgi:uridine monophosphate synthetase